eukprot:TRINITY_DN2758_c0_g1_i1.p1 TRINITY_DN2758_c0_g1~~TRINITY_DN2758_c0_g1_i1.p1  ORF type:complete len:243 (+),score=24.35 TRINITY_DN2758_c0_g1_i1:446-1174(+)
MDTLEKYNKLVSQWDGKDRVMKLLQNTVRLLLYLVSRSQHKKAIDSLARMDVSFGDARRLFRLGGFIREYNNWLQYKPKQKRDPLLNTFERFHILCGISIELIEVGIWATKAKVLSLSSRWNKMSDTLWFVRLVYALVDAIHQHISTPHWNTAIPSLASKIHTKLKDHRFTECDCEDSSECENKTKRAKARFVVLMWTIVRIFADMCVCASGILGITHKGFIGFCGIVSALIGIQQSWIKLS